MKTRISIDKLIRKQFHYRPLRYLASPRFASVNKHRLLHWPEKIVEDVG